VDEAGREWLLGVALAASILTHGVVAYCFGRAEITPPEQFTPQQGKVSVQLQASIVQPPSRPRPREIPLPLLPITEDDRALQLPVPLPTTLAPVQPAMPEPPDEQLPAPRPEPPRREPKPAAVNSLPSVAAQGALDELPRNAVNPEPPYPLESRARGEQGRVWLHLTIDATGKVIAASIHESSGYPMLDQSALETITRWRFHPGRRNGMPVAMDVLKPFDFSLRKP
jgi:periplasmic protein TonB